MKGRLWLITFDHPIEEDALRDRLRELGGGKHDELTAVDPDLSWAVRERMAGRRAHAVKP
jgi:hypothetical protein